MDGGSRPYIANSGITNPDFDFADFSAAGIKVATGEDGKVNVLPINQDLVDTVLQ